MGASLTGMPAIVTGSDSGIGRAIAEEMAKDGADIAIVYLHDRAGAEETRRHVEACGRRAAIIHCDISDEQSVARLFAETEAQLGTPCILVNNAGIGGGKALVAEMETADWDRIIKTDLYGAFFCCRAFIRARLAKGGGGKIINITSVHDTIPSPGHAAYGAAKGGLANLTRSLALELAPHRINVINIAPGLIHTPMTRARVEDRATRERELPNIPWRRPGQPFEIGRLAAYLASNDADYITGQTITIDGGLEMNWGQGA